MLLATSCGVIPLCEFSLWGGGRAVAPVFPGQGGDGRLPEADPGYDDYERGGDVDLDEVVTHRPHKLELAGEPGVVAYTNELCRLSATLARNGGLIVYCSFNDITRLTAHLSLLCFAFGH
jgi:hypothetical protein